MLITEILSQLVPENDPKDQLCKFTMLESSANVNRKSVIAEQIYPIMTPQITSMDIFFTFFETSNTKPMEIIAPENAAKIIMAELIVRPRVNK